jgi:hypothetical protein
MYNVLADGAKVDTSNGTIVATIAQTVNAATTGSLLGNTYTALAPPTSSPPQRDYAGAINQLLANWSALQLHFQNTTNLHPEPPAQPNVQHPVFPVPQQQQRLYQVPPIELIPAPYRGGGLAKDMGEDLLGFERVVAVGAEVMDTVYLGLQDAKVEQTQEWHPYSSWRELTLPTCAWPQSRWLKFSRWMPCEIDTHLQHEHSRALHCYHRTHRLRFSHCFANRYPAIA